jgi:hypothetical protein
MVVLPENGLGKPFSTDSSGDRVVFRQLIMAVAVTVKLCRLVTVPPGDTTAILPVLLW